jgi:endonuclease G
MHRLVALLVLLACAGVAAWHLPGTTSIRAEATAASQVGESPHLTLGTPTDADPSDDYIITRPQYVVSYSRTRNAPNWAAWKLTASDFGGQARHHGHFLADASLPAGWYHPTHADFTGTGYDRGHLVRSEDRTRSRVDNDATFLLSNVLPQRHDLNGGPWLRLEDACRAMAQHEGHQLYIVAGGVFPSKPTTIGHGVAVPTAVWKVVVVLAPGQGPEAVTTSTRTIAVVMPNSEGILEQPWTSYVTTIAAVERVTGYKLLGHVAEPVRQELETAKGWRP